MTKLLDIFKSILPNIENISSIPFYTGFGPGWILGALGIVTFSVFSLSVGRTKAIISLLSIYVAYALTIIFPYSNEVKNILGSSHKDYLIKLGIFMTAYSAIFIIFNFSFIRRRLSSAEYSLFGILLLSLIQFGLIASIILNILPISVTSRWLPYLHIYFSSSTALFFWAIIPLPVLLFIKK